MVDEEKKQRISSGIGWFAAIATTLIACAWTAWGTLENFHEGWFYPSLGQNLGLMVGQYLSLPLVFVLFGLLALRWPATGCLLHAGAALGAAFFFRNPTVALPFISLPMFFIGIAYLLGRAKPRRAAQRMLWIAPTVVFVALSIEPIIRISGRLDDGDYKIRRVQGDGVDLEWAPAGPGWPDEGVDWYEAMRRCQYLSRDGTRIERLPQNHWRLPTVRELVESLTRGGKNAGGNWDDSSQTTWFDVKPDKETPLWRVHSPIIYYWAADSPSYDDGQAWFVAFNGKVNARPKRDGPGTQSFRAVRAAPGAEESGPASPPVPK